jgi:plastocyanin
MKTAMIIIGIVLLVLIGAGIGYQKVHKATVVKTTTVTQAPATNSSNTATSTPTTADSTTSAVTITYSNSGFSPATVTVKSGGTVTIKNTSSKTVDFDSDPHPSHTDDSQLNAGPIAAGQSKTITVTTTGSFSYHNHLNSSEAGKIVIQ